MNKKGTSRGLEVLFLWVFVHHQVEVNAPLFDKITQIFVLFIFYQNAV